MTPQTDSKCRNTKPSDKPVILADGGQRHLRVQPNGSKLWRLNHAFGGKQDRAPARFLIALVKF